MLLNIVLFVSLSIIVGLLGTISIHIRWLVMMLLFGSFIAVVGKLVTAEKKNGRLEGGRFEAVLIDHRFKISLSRLQIVLWSILVLGTIAIVGLDRCIPVILGEREILRQDLSGQQASSQNLEEPYGPLNISLPEELLVTMGISIASLAGSSWIQGIRAGGKSTKTVNLLGDQKKTIGKKIKNEANSVQDAQVRLASLATELTREIQVDEGAPEFERAKTEIARINNEISQATKELNDAQKELDLAKQEIQEIEEADRVAQGDIHVNEFIGDADWSDLFSGSLVSNFRVVEIAKLQMFFFTVVIIFSYATLVWGMLGDTEGLRAATVQLPSFSGSLTALLGISHAGYLVVKQTQS